MSEKPALSYLICTGCGAGGSLLAAGLSRCQGAGTPAEHFSRARIAQRRRAIAPASEVEPFDKVVADAVAQNNVFAAQLSWEDCQELARILVAGTPAAATGGSSDASLDQALRRRLGDVRYIWVSRNNKVAQAIACCQSRAAPGSGQFDWRQIEAAIALAQQDDLRWTSFFRSNRERVLHVVYENLIQEPEQTFKEVLAYLGAPQDGLAVPSLALDARQEQQAREWEQRYWEMKKEQEGIGVGPADRASGNAASTSGASAHLAAPKSSVSAGMVEGGQPQSAAAAPGMPRIFVPIPSYRDTECQWTVKDLFEKAKHPERIFVGVCWQTVPEEDTDCFQVKTRPEQCREVHFHVRESQGTCWARQHAESLWRGEEYYFQIDAHNRFAQDWDEKLLQMLTLCASERPILSTYAVPYVPPDKRASGGYVRIHPQDFSEEGRLRIRTTTVPIAQAPKKPEPSAFITGQFLFGRSQLIQEVPHDPYIYTNAEDNTWGPRLWTAGWDFFVPNQVLVYHDFTDRRVKHWDDHRDWKKLQGLSAKRIRHLYRQEVCDDPEALRDFARYDLGTRRSLAEYEAFAGIDFKRRLVNGKTYEQITMEVPAEKRRARVRDVFRRQWEEGRTGPKPKHKPKPLPPPASDHTQQELGRLFAFLEIETLADAGCGDRGWIKSISPSLRLYLGFDIIDEIVKELREKYGRQRGHFFSSADICIDMLPACDAILCRDVMTRLPLPYVQAALDLFKASGSRYLIATTCERERNSRLDLQQSQDISLTIAPFNLPAPMFLIGDPPGSKRSLGVWRLAGLPGFGDSTIAGSDFIGTAARPTAFTAAPKNTVRNVVQGGAALADIEDRYCFEFSGKTVRGAAYGHGYLSELCRILDTYVEAAAKSVLEWGSGLTTQVLAEYGQTKWNTELLLTIDNNRSYQEAVFANRAKPAFLMAKCLDQIGPTRSSADQGFNYSTFPISLKKTFDLVLIDGRRRVECAFIAATVCDAETLVILHDYRRERYQPILALFDVVEDGPQFRVLRLRPAMLAAMQATPA